MLLWYPDNPDIPPSNINSAILVNDYKEQDSYSISNSKKGVYYIVVYGLTSANYTLEITGHEITIAR